MSLMIHSADIEGYRSIRSIHAQMADFSVILGKNGCGKTNLFKALRLLQNAANGTIIHAIASEGGLSSALWAGNKYEKAETIKLSVALGQYHYTICIGYPAPNDMALRWSTGRNQETTTTEPIIKSEVLIRYGEKQPETLMERSGSTVLLQQLDGRVTTALLPILGSEPALHHIQDGVRFPEMEQVRDTMENWRFYHQFQTHPHAAIRKPSLGLCTPALSPTGDNLAALLDTLIHYNHKTRKIAKAVSSAFPGSDLLIKTQNGKSVLSMTFPGMERPFAAHELSEGTLRFLCLIGALTGLRSSQFIALNEPEMSLHPDFMDPMAKILFDVSKTSQVWITTHSIPLINALQKLGAPSPYHLQLRNSQTRLEDHEKAA